MTTEHDPRPTLIALGLCMSITLAAFPAAAQQSPLPTSTEETAAAEESPELAELERKTRDLRSQLEEWKVNAAEDLAARQ